MRISSLGSCQKRFLWTHTEVDLAPHPVVGLVLQVGDTEKFPRVLRFQKPGSSFQAASRVHVSQPQSRMEVTKRLEELELACNADGVTPPDPV